MRPLKLIKEWSISNDVPTSYIFNAIHHWKILIERTESRREREREEESSFYNQLHWIANFILRHKFEKFHCNIREWKFWAVLFSFPIFISSCDGKCSLDYVINYVNFKRKENQLGVKYNIWNIIIKINECTVNQNFLFRFFYFERMRFTQGNIILNVNFCNVMR